MITSIDTQQLIKIFDQAEKSITSKRDSLNNLNVYPVPDGDTGTNMSLTLKEIVKNIDSKKDYSFKELGDIIADSSLMGGRGNSGVILSQFLDGFCEIIKRNSEIDSKILLKAFQKGTKEAYHSVSEPVEGTILTVMKAATQEMEDKSDWTDIARILRSTINRSQITLQQTPDMLPKLKEAGVVDAGGAGFVYFLEGFYRALTGQNSYEFTGTDDYSSPKLARIWEETSGVFGMGGLRSILDFNIKALKVTFSNTWWLAKKGWNVLKMGFNLISLKKAVRLVQNLYKQMKLQNIKETNFSIFKLLRAWQETPDEKYCMEAILTEVKLEPKEIKEKLSKVGKSIIVGQKGKYTKIHFHTKNKSQAEEIIEKIGKIEKIKIDDLQKQHKEFMGKKVEKEDKSTSVVAVTNGEGFSKLYKSFEGVFVVYGGKTMNPSVSDLQKAISDIDCTSIIILPNNKNIFLAAEQISKKSSKNIKVLKTYDQAQGLTTLLNFNPQETLTQNLEIMNNSLKLVETFRVSRSTKETSVAKVRIKKGEYFSLKEKGFLSKGKQIDSVVLNSLKKILDKKQLVTLYFGNNLSISDASKLKQKITSKYNIEVLINQGDQPHYHYIVSLE